MLLPKNYYKTKIINVLLPGAEIKKSIITKTKIIRKYYYRGNIINENKKNIIIKRRRTGRTL